MTIPAIAVADLGKAYFGFRSELRRFARWFGFAVSPDTEHWAVRHVSFQVDAGEALAIVGQNGAGKSTILKMMVGTTRQTEGSIVIQGRVAALLELGLGFNPELTGRENAKHAAGLMGLSRTQIAELLPDIEAFAEIGEYFDEPIRTYSSGMQMRLAFSVATAFRPDVLIVDEALAVGDAYFVHKCFQRIRQFREAGTTLVLVSHDPGAVQALCDRAILLDGGRLVMDGLPQHVIDYYNALIAEKENRTVTTTRLADGFVATKSGSGEATIDSVALLDADGKLVEYVAVGQTVTLRAEVHVHDSIDRLIFGYMIRDRLGQPVFGTNTHYTGQPCTMVRAGDRIEYLVRFPANLGAGTYSVSVALTSTETHLVRNYQWRDLALVFTVANVNRDQFVGMAWMPPTIEVRDMPHPDTEAFGSVSR